MTYTRESKVDKSPATAFSEQFVTTTYTSRTTIHNRHTFPLNRIIVRDTLPVSDGEGQTVRIILRDPEALVGAKDKAVYVKQGSTICKVQWYKSESGDESGRNKGIFEWICYLEAGEKATVQSVWDIKAAADVKWEEVPQWD